MRHLELRNLDTARSAVNCGRSDYDSWWNHRMAGAIQSMPMLTSLLLRGVCNHFTDSRKCVVLMDVLMEALRGLQQLRSVSLCSCTGPVEVHPERFIAEALAQLPREGRNACMQCGRAGAEAPECALRRRR